MATYHLSAKPISRSAGRSTTGAAAYRAGVEITDERTGLVHDYSRKAGVMHKEMILPSGGTVDRAEFWNRIELHHKRGDAVLSREVEVSLPTELTKNERKALAVGFARELADRYGVAADVALHAPRTITDRELKKNPDQHHEIDPETGRRHNGNWHAHIMLSACRVSPTGELGKKAVELDPIHCQRAKIDNMVDRERVRWGDLANAALERAGHESRIDHSSHKERGIEAEPTRHLGPAAAGLERRTGEKSQKRTGWEQNAADLLARAQEIGRLERERAAVVGSIIDLTGDLKAAVAERDHQQLKIKQRQENEQRINSSLERIGGNVRAAARTRQDASGALLASKQHLVATTGHTRDIVRGTQGAIEGVERRITERDYGQVVTAAKRQFERADNLLQQAVGHFDDVIQPIAAAAKHVEIYTVERERQAKERAQAVRQAIEATNPPSTRQNAPVAPSVRVNPYAGLSAKELVAAMDADAAKTQIFHDNRARRLAAVAGIEKTVAASDLTPEQRAIAMARVRENAAKSVPKAGAVAVDAPQVKRTRLAGEDVTLFKGAERALAAGDMKALASHLRKIDQVETTLSSAATPNRWDTKKFDEDQEARQLAGRDFNRRREAINAEAKDRGEKKIPFAVQGTFTSATYDHYQEEATKAIERHLDTQRPLGFFGRETKDTKAWDTRIADLERYKATCDKAIAWRDGAEAAAKTADGMTFYSRLDAVRNEHEAKSTGAIAKCASFKGRLQDFAQERKRIERAIGALGPQDQKELALECGRSHGMGR